MGRADKLVESDPNVSASLEDVMLKLETIETYLKKISQEAGRESMSNHYTKEGQAQFRNASRACTDFASRIRKIYGEIEKYMDAIDDM